MYRFVSDKAKRTHHVIVSFSITALKQRKACKGGSVDCGSVGDHQRCQSSLVTKIFTAFTFTVMQKTYYQHV